jgi:two-component system cell cycle sensor histidine kinase/response regulator CckA
MTRPIRVLHLEDSPRDAEVIQHRLEVENVHCDFVVASDRESFEAALESESFDLIISDYNLPGYGGIAALGRAQEKQPDAPVIIISGSIGEDEAVRCLQTGATDYLLKERLERLASAVRRAIEETELRRQRRQVQDALIQRERSLRENEERTNFALAAAGMGVWQLELGTNVVSWSATMAPLFGLTPDTLPKALDEVFSLIHPDDRDAVKASVERAIAGERAYAIEFRCIWPDGSTHWISGRAKTSYGPDGKSPGLIGISIDITERKSLEAQLRQSQKLEAVGQLAGGVAHDFNNLLTAILGYSNFVVDTFEAGDRRHSDIREVIKAGERAATLTRQLLAFSRKQVLQPVAVDLNALITGIRQMLGRLIGEHIDLVTVLPSDLRAVRADPGQIEQIVMNLVVNARDAMPTGGRVAIETANIELGESYAKEHKSVRPGSYVMLAVSDSGIGMNEETKQRLFEPFFTTKEPGKGTGLGLATVHGIVQQSNGHVWVDSEPGAGTVFKIYLPAIDRGEDVSVPTARDEVIAAGTETLLVVEDEEAVRFLSRVILEKAGYRVFDAPTPERAEAVFDANPALFDLLVTDVIMPGSSGPKLFERLAQRRPDLKVLYVSGYTDDAIVHQGQLDPGIEFLQKPFSAEDLSRRVREVLDR